MFFKNILLGLGGAGVIGGTGVGIYYGVNGKNNERENDNSQDKLIDKNLSNSGDSKNKNLDSDPGSNNEQESKYNVEIPSDPENPSDTKE